MGFKSREAEDLFILFLDAWASSRAEYHMLHSRLEPKLNVLITIQYCAAWNYLSDLGQGNHLPSTQKHPRTNMRPVIPARRQWRLQVKRRSRGCTRWKLTEFAFSLVRRGPRGWTLIDPQVLEKLCTPATRIRWLEMSQQLKTRTPAIVLNFHTRCARHGNEKC